MNNSNTIACNVYANAQSSSSGTPETLIGTIQASEQKQFTISAPLSNGYVVVQYKATDYNDSEISSVSYTYVAPALAAPTISVVSNTPNSITFRISNPNNVVTSFNGTYSSDDGISHSLSDSSIASQGHADHTIAWTNGMSFIDVSGRLIATDYNDSPNGTATFDRPAEVVLIAPAVTINSVTPNGLMYDVNFQITNTNNVACDVYANAQSSTSTAPQTLIGTLNANSSANFTIATSLSSGYIVSKLTATDYTDSANGYHDYSYVVTPSATSIPVNVIMENDGQGGYRANVYITNNSTYNLSGTMSDFTIHDLAQSGAQTISALNVNSTVNLYGTVSHTTTESGERWNLTLNLTDGINNWTLNYEGYLA
jgi:hypothetical protein